MLVELHAKDLALIEDVWLEFAPGMTVLTGETGAGKTALVGALKLLLGERADSGSVRAGTAETLVEGRFELGGVETLVKRRVTSDGRSRCAIDGEMATVTSLAEQLGSAVDLHGQHEHQALLRPATHVGYLDRWIGANAREALEGYQAARESYRAALAQLDEVRAGSDRAAAEVERLRILADEVDRIGPLRGEDDELEGRLPALQHSEQLAHAADETVSALRSDDGALDRIARALAALDRVSGIDARLDEVASRLREYQTLLDDVSSEARSYRDGLQHDSASVDALQSRLAALSGLKKRFGPSLDAVLDARESARSALEVADDSEGALARAAQSVATALAELRDASDKLDAVRRGGAREFSTALESATADLGMAGARFEVLFSEVAEDAWPEDGPVRVEIGYAPAASQPARPLSRIASGGELSRVMLALKGVLRDADEVSTLVFDEVDAGIGGATATAVGRRLAELAKSHQVIVITHLAQVAAFADAHLVVRKVVGDGDAITSVMAAEGDARVVELARMLSGDDASQTGLAHARELLSKANG